ncbi:RNA-binding protein 33 [Eurosta solidaginis]|uniref:RNA-binding protein 33 n=1 Tax=Eurosta solidaginis TaxID=178769 RepID=UPI00353101BE
MSSHTAHFTMFSMALALLSSPVRSSFESEQQQQAITTPNTANALNAPDSHSPRPEAAELTLPTQFIANSTRYARLMKMLQDPKASISKRYHAVMQRVITRADHLPPVGNPQRRSSSAVYPPSLPFHQVRPPMMRRIQHGSPANAVGLSRNVYDVPKGNANYPHSKGPVPFNAGKLSFHRSPFVHTQPQQHKLQQSHANVLIPHTSFVEPQHQHQYQASQPHPQYQPSPQHQLHPQQAQQQQHHEEHNFKASPPFNGKAIVRPLLEPHDPNYRQHMQQLQQYVGGNQPQLTIKQYPIPQQPLQQQHQSPHFPQASLLQAQPLQTFSHNHGPRFHYETIRPREEPVLQPHVKHILPPPGGAGYAVYENNELEGEEEPPQPYATYYPPTPRAEESSHVFHQSEPEANPASTAAIQEAEKYIEFMNSNDYFLPKREPNYKQRDTQQDRQQNQQQQREQQQQLLEQQQQSQIQQAYAQFSRAQTQTHYGNPAGSDTTIPDGAAANHLNAPIKISQLFYQEDPVPAVVRTSYQTGNNNHLVVNSNGKKAVKHIPQSQTTRSAASTPTTSAPTYSKVRHNTPRNRTPEPQRFEFTERDAMPSAYTHSPSSATANSFGDQLRHRAAGTVGTASTPNLPATSSKNYNTANLSSADDPEDEEDVHSASSSFYGRMPVRQSTEADATTLPTPPAPVEQKDTEDYCEQMCANVQDSDEEIICGSDGYMYTSEAQMECYASCLHIDVTITSKGSCVAR